MSEQSHKSDGGKKFFLFSHARTMSNLLLRILSGQQDLDICDYHFQDAFLYARRNLSEPARDSVPASAWSHYEKLVTEAEEKMRLAVQSASDKGHSILIKNHCYHVAPIQTTFDLADAPIAIGPLSAGMSHNNCTSKHTNPTVFSDHVLRAHVPIFLIRHPAATFSSWYRVEAEPSIALDGATFRLFTTFQLSRQIFDWYRSTDVQGMVPLVIDADDILERPEVLEELCRKLGLDKDRLMYSWQANTDKSKHSAKDGRFLGTLWDSTGVDRSKSSRAIDIEAKEREWVNDFGADVAAALKERVCLAMPDYTFLRSFALSV